MWCPEHGARDLQQAEQRESVDEEKRGRKIWRLRAIRRVGIKTDKR